MPGTDPHYAATEPINRLGHESVASLQVREALRRRRLRWLLSQSPRTAWGVLARFTRFSSALALAMPVLCGAALAWWQTGALNPLALALNWLATFTLALGIHSLSEYYDFKAALASQASSAKDPQATGYGLLVHGKVDAGLALNLGYLLLLISALCGLWLPIIAGWPPLFFAGVSVALLITSVAPPLRLSGRGWGLGEAVVFVAFGLMQVLNSYYVQTESLSWLAGAVSVPLGLLCVLLYHNYNSLFEHRDWQMRKRTVSVQLGPLRALDISAFLILCVHIAIVAIVSLAWLPFGMLLTLFTLPVALGAYARVDRERLAPEDHFQLYRATISATLWIGIIFCAVLAATIVR